MKSPPSSSEPRPFASTIQGFLTLILFTVIHPGLGQPVSPLSPRVIDPANGHTYLLLTSGTWTSSETEAVQLGGHLATIRNQVEQNWVYNAFGDYGARPHLLWIGLNDVGHVFIFNWTSGEPFSYSHWAPGEPNNAGGVERYVAMYYPGHSAASYWNDWSDRSTDPIGLPFNGVVEIVPEPKVATPILAAFVALWATRRSRTVA